MNDAQTCDLCAGKCRGHSLGHADQWEPEVGSLAHAQSIVERLTDAQKRALLACADNRADLPNELIVWRTMPGHRFPSPKLSNLGYAVRALLENQNG